MGWLVMMLLRWSWIVLAGFALVVAVSCGGRGGVSISVSPSEVALSPGESVTFTATVVGGANRGVTWSASGGGLVPSGLTAVFTAPVESGEYTVTVRSAADQGRWASAVVTVSAGGAGQEVVLHEDSDAAIELGDGAILIEVPRGAVDEPTTLLVSQVAPELVPAGLGDVDVVAAVGIVSEAPLQLPATISFAMPGAAPEGSAWQIMHFSSGSWTPVPTWVRDQRVATGAMSFSTFALVSQAVREFEESRAVAGFSRERFGLAFPNLPEHLDDVYGFPEFEGLRGVCLGMTLAARDFFSAGVEPPVRRGVGHFAAFGADAFGISSDELAGYVAQRQSVSAFERLQLNMGVWYSGLLAAPLLDAAETVFSGLSTRPVPVGLGRPGETSHAVLAFRGVKQYYELGDLLQYRFDVYDPNGYEYRRSDNGRYEHRHFPSMVVVNARGYLEAQRLNRRPEMELHYHSFGEYSIVDGEYVGVPALRTKYTAMVPDPVGREVSTSGVPWSNPQLSNMDVVVDGARATISVAWAHPSVGATLSRVYWVVVPADEFALGQIQTLVWTGTTAGLNVSTDELESGAYVAIATAEDLQGNYSNTLTEAFSVAVDHVPPFVSSLSYVSISNVRLAAASGGTRRVSFDISWPESWRGPARPTWVEASDNWDAVWVFVKYRVSGGPWQHATLAQGGHVRPLGVEVSVPSDRVGAFIYRSSSGYGTFTANGVGLHWDYLADGVAAGASVEVQPFGIEMVYVPQGSFSVGSGGSSTGEFRAGGTSNTPFVVSSQSSISLGNSSGQLMWTTGGSSDSPLGSTNASFPTGFGAYYVMKYQVTQGQYVDFLNTLTQAQADVRKYTGSSNRYAITGSSVGSYATSLPFVAMNYMSWADGAAFADWAGLRPMTELEFEKVARGPLSPVANEFAWGSTSITQATGLTTAGTITETPTPAGANAAYGSASGVQGPVRVGSFAAPGRSRRDAGAGFYGALELSGNLRERTVTVGNAEGRAFTGAHGDGTLDASGNANVASWPGSNAVGAGFRGGSWLNSDVGFLRVSDRFSAASTLANRRSGSGWRGARAAP